MQYQIDATAQEQGRQAYIRGEMPDTNPYPKDSALFQDWSTGYWIAHAEDR